jgi:putative flavoprotein involved in K+ transport
VTHHEVIIVGAGPAGLGAAARLRGAGFDPVLIDRADTIGSAWRTRYDSFRLHTIRWLSALPGMAIPPGCGPWVSRDDFIAYLQRYAERFGLVPQLGVELRGLTATDGGWTLTTSAGPLEGRRVVLATGACTEPRIPAWPGSEAFVPPIVHSSKYRNPDPYAGRTVLVVGSGNSATEIATDLAAGGEVRVEMAVRTPPTILRRDTRGIPTQPIGIALRYAPPAVVNPLGATMRRLTIPDLSAQGLPAPKRPYSQFLRSGTVPVLDHGFVAAVRSGAITVRPAVAALAGGEVLHSDGSRSAPDAVIAATGYTTGLEPILGELGLIDARGLPTVGSRGGPSQARGLYTVGIAILLSGLLREIGKDANRLARAITRS